MKKVPKAKKGAWYVRVRGSYLPVSWQGWLMHLLLVGFLVSAMVTVNDNRQSLFAQALSLAVDFFVAWSFFTFIAEHKS